MAGELEHIRPSNPSDGWYVAARTRNINWVDANGVSRSISHVYWSPTNNVNDRKLIWQRDHSPTQTEYIELNNNQILFKWVATSNNITSVCHWCKSYDNYGQNLLSIFNNDGTLLMYQDNADISLTNDTLYVNGQTISVKKAEITNLNISVTQGNTYYIGLTKINNQSYLKPYAYKDIQGEYWTVSLDMSWQLKQNMQQGNYTTHSDYKIKAEVNGVQV